MDSPDLIIIISTLILSAFFSGVEIAFISSNRLKIELDKNKGSLNGRIVGYFYSKDANFIATLSLGNNIALVLFAIFIAKVLGAPIIGWNIGITDGSISLLIAQTIISALIILITVEFSPKAIFQLNPNGFMKTLAIPTLVMYWLLFIPTSFVLLISKLFFMLMRVEITNSEKVFSKVDLEHYIQDLKQRSNEEEDFGNEMQILQNALDFSKIRARDCMVPRPEIICLEVDDSIENLNNLFVFKGISKVIIYRDNIDNIIGYVHSFEMFKKPTAINQIMRPIAFVPAAIPGKELLEMFTKQSANISVVVDEYGGTAGIVTIEDVIEEIFGEIEDEHDVEDMLEEQINENEYRFSARIEIDYLNENYKFEFEESDEYETLGGLIIHHLASIPEAGDVLDLGKYHFTIEAVSDRRIELVKLVIHV